MQTPAGAGRGPLATLYGAAGQRINRIAPLVALLGLGLALPDAVAAQPAPPSASRTFASGGPVDPDQAKLVWESATLAFEIFPDRKAIAGDATLVFTARAPLDRLVIDLDRRYRIASVAIDGRPLAPSAWANPDGRLVVRLPARAAAGDRLSARIVYAGTPHVAARPPWEGGFVWSRTPAGAPWIATAVQGEGCDLFWPCLDHPSFEPARIDLAITVPRGLKAVSNGRLTGTETLADGRSTWRWSATDPTPYGIALNVAPYEVIRGTYRSRFGNSFPMEYWHLPGNEAQARGLFAEFAPMLDFFEATIGPYPFAGDKMGVVETPHLGMEHQTVNAYGNAYRKAPEGFDWLLQHELAHEWFGNQMTNADWDDMWLHEGYGTYMQPLYGRWREGEARYAIMLEAHRNRIVNGAPLVSGRPSSTADAGFGQGGRGGDIYFKGAWMLHTLRNTLGDAAFEEITRRLVYGRPDPRPGNIRPRAGTTAEYRRIVDQVAGRPMGWFFDVYLDERALPELVETRAGNRLTLRWQTPRNRPFPLPVEVQVDGEIRRLAMANGTETIELPPGAHVVIDPWSRILKRSHAVEAVQAQAQAQAQAAR